MWYFGSCNAVLCRCTHTTNEISFVAVFPSHYSFAFHTFVFIYVSHVCYDQLFEHIQCCRLFYMLFIVSRSNPFVWVAFRFYFFFRSFFAFFIYIGCPIILKTIFFLDFIERRKRKSKKKTKKLRQWKIKSAFKYFYSKANKQYQIHNGNNSGLTIVVVDVTLIIKQTKWTYICGYKWLFSPLPFVDKY